MAFKDPTDAEILALLSGRHPQAGALFITRGLPGYYFQLLRILWHNCETGGAWLKVRLDDANATTVQVTPGRATMDGSVVAYAGEAVDLAAFNNDVAYVWLADDGTLGYAADGTGWPSTPHVKLAEVTLVSGAITQILDLRPQSLFRTRDLDITIPLPDISATASFPFITPNIDGVTEQLAFVTGTAIATDNSNYYTFSAVNKGAAGTGNTALLAATDANTTKTTGGSAMVANVARTLTLHGTPANLNTTANNVQILTVTKTGAPATMQGCVLRAHFTLKD